MLSNSHRFSIFMCTGEYPDTCGQGLRKERFPQRAFIQGGPAPGWLRGVSFIGQDSFLREHGRLFEEMWCPSNFSDPEMLG